MKKVLILFFLIQLFFVSGQDLDNYKGIESKGQVPADLVTHSSDKFDESVDNEINKKDKRSTKKAKKKFLLNSSFQLRELLYSGKVMFNDTLSQYISKVAAIVTQSDPTLHDQIRFYVLKSSSVNGFATNDGMIFITMGLLSQLENEAQLAYVLAHEISHYTKKHVINKYVESSKTKVGYGYAERKDAIVKQNKYSKELETEADLEGFKLFQKTKYKQDGVEQIFDVLKYSYLPFDDIAFDTTIFQAGNYVFPQSYWVEELNEIAVNDEYDEEKSTHPDPVVRKSKIKALINKSANASAGSYYQVEDKAYFEYIRDVARFELAKILLKEHKYKKAVYHVYLLQQKFKNNEYLDEMLSFALYYQFRNVSSSEYSLIDDTYEYSQESDIEGESHRVFYWLEEMPTEEIGILALKFALENEHKYKNNKSFKDISFDLMYMLARDYEITYQTFEHEYLEKKTKELVVVEEQEEHEDNEEPLNKLDKIKKIEQEKEEEEIESENNKYFKYALVDVFKTNDELENRFLKSEELSKNTKEEFQNRTRITKKEKRILGRQGHAFGVNKLVVVSPEYNKVNLRKRQALSYDKSENALSDLSKEIKSMSAKADLEVEVLDELSIKENEVNRFNDFMFLNDWLQHSSRFLEKTDTSFLVCLDQDKIDDLRSKYDTDYYCWTGFSGVKKGRLNRGYVLMASIPYVVTIPMGLYYLVSPSEHTSYYTLVFNMQTKKAIWSYSGNYNTKDTRGAVRSILYDTYYQIKRKPKK